MNIDYQQKVLEITAWIKKTVADAGFKKVVIAVSGGVDSSVALSLAVKALGIDNVYALLMPNGKMSTTATEDGKLIARNVGLKRDHVLQRDINKVLNKIVKTIDQGPSTIDQIRLGNIMARIRMIFLYDLAKFLNALVVGTENKSEYYLGYFTRFGDEASDLEPIRSLYKTQVWEMAKYLKIPERIIQKSPTAGLWEGQTDEKEFGFSYAEGDRVLFHYFEEKLPLDGIVGLGFDKNLVEKVLDRVQKNDFKHQLPKIID